MSRRFSNLRGRLIASHVAVILITVALMGLISAGLLRQYEVELESQRLKEIAAPLTLATTLIESTRNLQFVRIDAIDRIAAENDVRLLVFGADGVVLYDTDPIADLAGQQLSPYSGSIIDTFTAADRSGRGVQQFAEVDEGAVSPFGEDRFLIAVPGGRGIGIATGVVAPERRYPLVDDFLPRFAGVIALAVALASLAGYLLSKRIASPLSRLTTAAQAMTAGKLEQQVSGEGPDELGRLVTSFNQMSKQVSDTYASQRSLLADVAHELRTPLTSVQGYAQALQDGVVTDEAGRNQALGVINREAQRMSALIAQLLDLARLESGQSIFAQEPVDLAELTRVITERFEPLAAAESIELTTLSTPGITVKGDFERLDQAVSNLVANAIRHTPAGGKIELLTAPAADGQAIIRVSDSGSGIPQEALPQLFDRFYRVDANGSVNGGFGLGLAIVHEVVERHNGSIDVTSKPGEGSVFTITLQRLNPERIR